VENQVRELDAKLLLACVAARRGLTPIIGPKREVESRIASFPRSVYVAKSMVQGNAQFLRIAHNLGHTFDWLWTINQSKAYFVTRLKKSIKWTRVISHPVDKTMGLRTDQEILLFSKNTKTRYPKRLRCISFRDETQYRTLVFLTNNFLLPADTIAALYKARWEIELFFKWIKQNFKVKSFYGTSPNAVKTQIWIAMSVNLSSLSSSLYFIHPPVMYAVLNLVYVPQSMLTLIVILLSIAISIPIIHSIQNFTDGFCVQNSDSI
jgi:hypothetical protein